MNDVTAAMVGELQRQDAEMAEASREMRLARIRYDIVSSKYQAVRDLIQDRTGRSPYADPVFFDFPEFVSEGRFRFVGMSPGDAILQVLKDSKIAMTPDEIGDMLRGGGLGLMPRSINAALMQMKGVGKTADEKYMYVPEDDMPFDT